MPFKKELYPPNWKEISLAIRERAGWRCEWCGAVNAAPHPVTGSKVVLTVAHLDHNPQNCDPSNLAALCQRCHLRYDVKQHAETRRRNAKLRKFEAQRAQRMSEGEQPLPGF